MTPPLRHQIGAYLVLTLLGALLAAPIFVALAMGCWHGCGRGAGSILLGVPLAVVALVVTAGHVAIRRRPGRTRTVATMPLPLGAVVLLYAANEMAGEIFRPSYRDWLLVVAATMSLWALVVRRWPAA